MGKGMRAGKAKKPQKAGGFNMQQLQQMQALQAQMERAQAELEEKEVTATAGGGVVEATVSGKKELTKLVIKPEVVDPDDVETLEDLVMAAVNEGLRQIDEISESTMGQFTGGLNIQVNIKDKSGNAYTTAQVYDYSGTPNASGDVKYRMPTMIYRSTTSSRSSWTSASVPSDTLNSARRQAWYVSRPHPAPAPKSPRSRLSPTRKPISSIR